MRLSIEASVQENPHTVRLGYEQDLKLRQMGSSGVKLPRKASLLISIVPVPQTDTGIRDEYSQARE